MSIVIIGGGIAGLTAAHELVEQGYIVTLIERNSQVGGLARTHQKENQTCPYEYSWRAYGQWYQNVYNIMKRIPFEGGTVYNKLTQLQGGVKTCSKTIPTYEYKKSPIDHIPYSDCLKLFPILLRYLVSCNERNVDHYSQLGLREQIHKLELSSKTETRVGKIVGPYLGMDYQHASVYDVLYAGEMIHNNSDPEFKFNITSLPTSHVWFEPWTDLLKQKGVDIKLNTEVTSVNIDRGFISSITVRDKLETYLIQSDYYVNCTGPEVLERFIAPYQESLYPFYKTIKNVAENGRQIQLSIYYYVDRKIYLDNENTLAYLPNTPWLLMVLPTGHIWGDEYMSRYCNPDIKEIVSVGICEPYVEGLYIKKKWSECTQDEIKIEAWYQLIHDDDFRKNSCIQGEVDNINIIDFKMWDSFVYKHGKMDTHEPKWANNTNTAQNRPNASTPIPNLFVAGAYSNTTTGLYSMESAAESGKIAAKKICELDHKSETIYLHTKKKYALFYILRWIDYWIYHGKFLILFIVLCILVKQYKLGR